MKIFWSWQSDTAGKTGRHFVRAALAEAIAVLKEPSDVEEPFERDVREALHLDHDRQGVRGTQDLAPTIFAKIDASGVFIGDVTLVGELRNADGSLRKKLINSNVAIEYGYARKALSDENILLVQNAQFGEPDELPFDLRHKFRPIQFRLAPDATKEELQRAQKQLCREFVDALKPYLGSRGASRSPFPETPTTRNIASYWDAGEVLARYERPHHLRRYGQSHGDETIEYRFDEASALYLRLIPAIPLRAAVQFGKLLDIVTRRRVHLLTRAGTASAQDRNRFGAVAYEPIGNSPVLRAFTQLFRNGEIWAVSAVFVTEHRGVLVAAIESPTQILRNTMANLVEVAGSELGMVPPFCFEIGAVGLKDKCLPVADIRGLSPPIYQNEVQTRRILNEIGDGALEKVVREFLVELYDVAGVSF